MLFLLTHGRSRGGGNGGGGGDEDGGVGRADAVGVLELTVVVELTAVVCAVHSFYDRRLGRGRCDLESSRCRACFRHI